MIDPVCSIGAMQAVTAHRRKLNRKTERYRRKCLGQLHFERTETGVQDITLEAQQSTQNRRRTRAHRTLWSAASRAC
ncbi:MAG: hypothetical protein ACI38U_13875 [Corynebacterium sp.]|jgi:hypothetical protein|uniref:hypothetical protein n=1 Tax=Corynebacterium sp. TaxID=1720 RepID=UPI003F026D33